MFGSNAASQRCGRSRIVGAAAIYLGIQNQIILRAADAREAGTGIGRHVGLLEIGDLAGFHRHGAGTAAARAAAGINLHALRLEPNTLCEREHREQRKLSPWFQDVATRRLLRLADSLSG